VCYSNEQGLYILPYSLQTLIFTIFLSLPVINWKALGGWGMWRAMKEMYAEVWWENLKEGSLLGRTTHEWVDIIEVGRKQIFTELCEVDHLVGVLEGVC
jgi:hypothetical protein